VEEDRREEEKAEYRVDALGAPARASFSPRSLLPSGCGSCAPLRRGVFCGRCGQMRHPLFTIACMLAIAFTTR